jgi:endonuclease YncB( thermonuclease family)
LAAGAFAQELRGKVICLANGDIIIVFDTDYQQLKVRLNWIDAPESKSERAEFKMTRNCP